VASGKGGTGKTTVATNLAWVAAGSGASVAYLDCDVEEPNGQIFLQPAIRWQRPVSVPVPRVEIELCDHCGLCGEICRHSAIVCMGQRVLTFEELCHSCGGCARVCPQGAIVERPREIGSLASGDRDSIRYVQGLLNIGEAMSPPVIRAVKGAAPAADLVIVDAPPGTTCPTVESIRGCDRLLLVAEPTPFGLHDLSLAVEMARALELHCQVVINRAGANGSAIGDYCRSRGLEIIAEIPEDRRVAEAYSDGRLAAEALPEFRDRFLSLLHQIGDRP
jgi:MinD superfamily P-loop ATPase